jgi:hypothetical protein
MLNVVLESALFYIWVNIRGYAGGTIYGGPKGIIEIWSLLDVTCPVVLGNTHRWKGGTGWLVVCTCAKKRVCGGDTPGFCIYSGMQVRQ